MAQQQISGLAALSCYTVDTDSEEEEEGGRVQDFGDLVIKQEVTEEMEEQSMAWRVDTQGHVDPVEEARVNSDFLNPQDIKVEIESEDESSSSSSDSSDSSDSEEEEEKSDKTTAANKDKEATAEGDENFGPPKTANEMLTKDLPPVDDVTAIVPAAECNIIGHIKNLVEDLVVVESLIGIPALDLESVLFVREGSLALGRVFDVIGPVTQPLYVVRFNSKQHIAERGITVGMKVYFAPKSELTSYVFLEQLMAMKISDASWVNDEEPPPQFLEYSDDEEEQRVKREHKAKKKAEGQSGDSGEATEPKRPRQQNKNLRQCNNRYTPDSNPFYRTSRGYNPQSGGGIQWSQYSVPVQYSTQYTHPPPFSAPPPGQYQAPPPPGPQYYPQYTQAQAAGAWQSQYSTPQPQYSQGPYQQLTSSIAQTQHHQSSLVASLSSPPPPPPPGE